MKLVKHSSQAVLALLLCCLCVAPATAQISADLAKKCRLMMLRADPIRMYGNIGRAASERRYFQQCISQRGEMPETKQDRIKEN